jgi:hypothetical protein
MPPPESHPFLRHAFASEYPEAMKIILYGGDHEEEIDGIKLIPLTKALPELERIIWPSRA